MVKAVRTSKGLIKRWIAASHFHRSDSGELRGGQRIFMSNQFLKIYFVPQAFSGWCWCFWSLTAHFENQWLRAWALHWHTCVVSYHFLDIVFSGKLYTSCWESHWESYWGFLVMCKFLFSCGIHNSCYSVAFDSLSVMHLLVWVSDFNLLGVHWVPFISIAIPSVRFWPSSAIISPNHLPAPFFLSLPSQNPMMHILVGLPILHMSLRFCSLFFILFFFLLLRLS